MEARTEAHLATADRNSRLARTLIEPAGAALVQPAPLEWAVVVAFYAAVHYANAYLWERRRYEPRTHEDRENAVHRTADLRSAAGAYRRLRAAAYQARYEPGFRLQHVAAALLVRTDLEEVAERVRQALASTP